jgi:hypothetical protein
VSRLLTLALSTLRPRVDAGETTRRGTVAAVLTVVGFAIVIWLLGGVDPDEIARFLGYHAAFVIAPGWLLFRAIMPGVRSPLHQFAVGWALGYVLEILAFSLTAALDVRDLFLLYPVVVALPAIIVWRRRRAPSPAPPTEPGDDPDTRWRWATCGLCLLALVYIGGVYFTETPLPGSVDKVAYNPDLTYHVAIAGEAKHHWPLESPNVAGEELSYHYFSHLDVAAASQVTGIEIPVVFFRLYLVPLTMLILLQLVALGRAITGMRWAGPIAAALFLLVDEVDLSTLDLYPFLGTNDYALWLSPSWLLGLAVFLPTLLLLSALLDPGVRGRWSDRQAAGVGDWSLLVLFLIGLGGAKGNLIPLTIGGLAVYLLWRRIVQRSVDWFGLAALALAVVVLGIFLVVLYGSSGGQGFRFTLDASVLQMPAIDLVDASIRDGTVLEGLFLVLATVVGTLMLFGASLLGLVWALPRRLRSLPAAYALPLAMFVAALVPYFLLESDGYNQLYFTEYAIVALLPIAGAGICTVLSRVTSGDLNGRALWAFAVIWVAILIGIALAALGFEDPERPLRSLLFPYALALGAALVVGSWIAANPTFRRHWVPFAVIAVLLTAAADPFIDWLPARFDRIENGTPIYSTAGLGLEPDEEDGLAWIRDHVDEDAVLLVDNKRSYRARRVDELNMDYSAFSERRAFFEGWGFSSLSPDPGPSGVTEGAKDSSRGRLALQRRALEEGDDGALRRLIRRYGVTHVVVDRKNGFMPRSLYRRGRVVYSNDAIEVVGL